MRRIALEVLLTRSIGWAIGTASLASVACQFVDPPQTPEPEPVESVTESEGQTEVTMTPLAPEPPAPEAPEPGPASPREGVHETGEQTRGRLAPAKIASVLSQHSTEFTNCYGVANDPALEGQVTLRIVIGGDGRVAHVEVVQERTTLNNDVVHGCLIDEARTLVFEKPVGGRVVTEYPLEFKALAEAPAAAE